MRLRQRWLYVLAGLPLLGIAMFWAGMVVTDALERDNTFCTSCHLHEEKFSQFHPVQEQRITLAAAHNMAGDLNVKCIDCHIGATFTDKVVIKAVAARRYAGVSRRGLPGTRPFTLSSREPHLPEVPYHRRTERHGRQSLPQCHVPLQHAVAL